MTRRDTRRSGTIEGDDHVVVPFVHPCSESRATRQRLGPSLNSTMGSVP